MKKFLLFVLTFLSLSTAQAVTKTWIAVSGNYSVAGNWSPSGAPTNTDDIVFSSTASCTIDGTFSPRSVSVTSGTTTLLATVTRTFSVYGSGTAGIPAAIDVAVGATLAMSASTGTFTLAIQSGGNGVINGTWQFLFTGTGATRLDAQSGSLLTINGTIYNNGNANPNSLTTTVTFASGSTYELARNGGTVVNALYNANSTFKYTGGTSSAPTWLSTTTLGHLVYDCAGQNSIINFSFPANVTIQGDLSVLNTDSPSGQHFDQFDRTG